MKLNLLNLLVSAMLVVFLSFEINAQTILNVKVFLEVLFNGTVMNTGLNSAGLITLTQPYNSAPWNYTGTENVASVPNTDIVDWVLVELRETTGDASTATADKQIHRQAAFLKSNGNIVSLDGNGLITYTGTITNNLYVIIWHRNHLAVLSSGALPGAGGVYAWDFTNQLSKAYLNGQKQLLPGIYGMKGGDSDASGVISGEDLISGWSSVAGKAGYISGDFNLDGQASNPDKNDIFLDNQGSTTPLLLRCGNPFVDVRDGQSYNSVVIGDQCWMAENLNVGAMIDGGLNPSNNATIEKYCYNNTISNCDEYGGLYLWSEMMEYAIQPGIQGICPADWHIPEFAEYTLLTNYLGGDTVAGGKMKETGTLHWTTPNTGATNESGFTGLPGGYIYYGQFQAGGTWSHLWSSTIDGPHAWYQAFYYYNANVYPSFGNFNYGFSVRCIKDTPPPVWSCGDTMTDVRDNQTYATVPIGDQCWMAENLNIGTMVPATTEMTNNSTIEKYCYGNNTADCDVYGGLYQWDEMMQYFNTPGVQGLCPDDWHLPTDSEWTALTDFLGGTSVAGGKLKETGVSHWNSPNTGATNESGFTALPGGARYYNSEFAYKGILARYWTSSDDAGFTAWFREMDNNSTNSSRYDYSKVYGFSVRCVKN